MPSTKRAFNTSIKCVDPDSRKKKKTGIERIKEATKDKIRKVT